MRKVFVTMLAAVVVAAITVVANTVTFGTGTVVFDSIPNPQPYNVTSLGFQATQAAELGDEIRLEADTPRRAGYATVLMSSWSLHASYPTMPAVGYEHPITLNIYVDDASAQAHQPVKSVTQNFVISWRPAADPGCTGGRWKAADGNCYNGFAFPIVFDLRHLNYDLPDQFIYGVEYNTNTWGYSPNNAPGPYESLNVGLNQNPPVGVGVDVNADALFWNTMTAAWYTDGGAGGVGTFRLDPNWTPYTPAVRFTTFAVPSKAGECKNGAWQNLVRADFSPFVNQGACVSYVQTGR